MYVLVKPPAKAPYMSAKMVSKGREVAVPQNAKAASDDPSAEMSITVETGRRSTR